ncbi:MAG: hypothetical protein RLY86_4118 [Pseudomonadota bacterium]
MPRSPARLMAAALLLPVVTLTGLPATATATPQPAKREARMVAGNCLLCHGTAAATGGMPVLKGQDPAVIAAALRDYRDGKRHGTIMPRIAKGYDDGVIDALAAYLATAEQ